MALLVLSSPVSVCTDIYLSDSYTSACRIRDLYVSIYIGKGIHCEETYC